MNRHLMTCVLVGVLVGALGGCNAAGSDTDTGECAFDTEGEYVPLIDHMQWQELDAADDPLADHRPATIECTIAGWRTELGNLEVDTSQCNYVSVHQPSLRPLCEGQSVELIFYHFDLTTPEPATGHVEILVDGQRLWTQEVEIPGPANVFDLEFPSPISAPVGSDIVFHLHNHGQNTWTLQDLNVRE